MIETDEFGRWEVDENTRILIEPSDKYFAELESRKKAQIEEEMLKKLKPTEEDIIIAKTELKIINLLQEIGVI